MNFLRWLLHLPMRLLRVLFSRAVLALIGLLALCAFIWFAGPLFAFADMRPLAPERMRWIVIGSIVALFLLWALVRLWRRKNLNAKLLEQIARVRASAKAEGTESVGQAEVEELRRRFAEGLASVKTLRLSKQGAHAFFGRYVYELPWYMIVGAPGSGKTTALVNSGLNFPLENQIGRAALKGIGGTRNCDWWITDQAIILDTAGRYSTQDSQAEVDRAEWQGFLDLLKKYRPRQPINGIILTLSVADLLAFTRAQRDAHYAALRARLSELQERFGIALPVYVWVTKADLLAGFNEFFDRYGAEQRKQVWGFTFPYHESAGTSSVARFEREWTLLQERLFALQDGQLAQETDPTRLSAIYSLPQQMAGLQSVLREAVQAVFRDSGQPTQSVLRGVYLSSATQEGNPFDRILSTLRRNFSGSRAINFTAQRNQGKSYFLHDLLAGLIFREAGLAGRNTRWELRSKWLTYAGYAVSVLLLAAATGAWYLSYRNNTGYLAQTGEQAAKLADAAVAYAPSAGDLMTMVGLLDAAQRLGDTPDFERGAPTLPYRYGLYQGAKVEVAANAAYARLLADGLLPLVAQRLEAQLRTPPVASLEYLYEALKAYLMLYQPEHYEADTLVRWMSADARRHLLPDADRATLSALEGHLRALFGGDRVVSSPLPMNQPLVAEARGKLATLTTTQRIYSRLRGRLESLDLPEFNLLDVAGPQGANVFKRRSGQPLNRGIDGLFTYQGYWDVFDKQVNPSVVQMGGDEGWVMGLPGKTVRTQLEQGAARKLAREVRMAYLRDYVETWEQYLADVQLVPSPSLQLSVRQLRVLSAPDSPLPLFLRAVVRETTLLREDAKGGERSLLDHAKQRLKNTQDDIERVVGPVAPRSGPGERELERVVDDHFEPLRRLVGAPGAQGSAPIDATLKLLDEYYAALVAAEAALRSGDQPPSRESAVRLLAEAARLPQPLRGMVNAIASSGSAQTAQVMRAAIGNNLNATVGDFCRHAVAGRYPLRSNAVEEVVPEDFARLFAPGGLMDEFFQNNLASIVDTTNWTFKRNIDGASVGGSGALASFRNAAVIRDVFFRDGGRMPTLRFEIKPVEMDPAISGMSLDVDGTVLRYGHGPQFAQTMAWPGPRGHNQVLLQVTGPELRDASLKTEGPWALYRFFDRLSVTAGPTPSRFLATATVADRKITFQVSANSVRNPFRLAELRNFSCPGPF